MSIITVKIFVPDISNVLSLFNKIQVQRSELGSPYSDAVFVTAGAVEAPVMVGVNEGPYAGLSGTTFLIKINGVEQSVTFTTPNPITLNLVIDQFNNAISGAVMTNDGTGKPRITGETSGTSGTLEIKGGSAPLILGFTPGQKVSGKDIHVSLIPNVESYEYNDRSGETTYWYRTRYFNQVDGSFSAWSDWIQGTTGTVIDPSYLITGMIRLSDINGKAFEDARIQIVNTYLPKIVDTYFIAGRSTTIETDAVGYAEITLIRGSEVDVIIEGTSFVRRISVPLIGESFDLMNPSLVLDDPFNIQVPDLPAAPRSS